MNKYYVASTLIKDMPNGLNIITDIKVIMALSKEEAIGKYFMLMSELHPDHYIHIRPLVVESED